VRYIGVDTPERGDCFSARATAFNAELVDRADVRLVPDAEPRDRYGRMLAYVYRGDTNVGAELVRRGYAQAITVPPNVRYADRFAALARQARRAGIGLWASCAS